MELIERSTMKELELLQREQKKNRIALQVLEACSQWGKVDKPTEAQLAEILEIASENIMQIAESEN